MNNSVRITLRGLAALLLTSVLGITILLIVGTDRSPLPDRESLLAHIESPPPDEDAFPLWREIFHDQHHGIDSNIRLMLNQTARWDADLVEQEIAAFEPSLPSLRKLRHFEQMRSDYSTNLFESSPFDAIPVAQLVIAAGLTRWQQGRHAEAKEFFLDAAHMTRLLHRDREANLTSLAAARMITLTLVSTLQRPIAQATTSAEIRYLQSVASQLQETSDDSFIKVLGNENTASRLWLLDNMVLPFRVRLQTAISSYLSLYGYCRDAESADPYCQTLGYWCLTTIFPRFYVDWPSLSTNMLKEYEAAAKLVELPCSELRSEASASTGLVSWQDYLTPGSLAHSPDSRQEHIRHALIDRCLANFFTRSQKIAISLKSYEIEHGETAKVLEVTVPDAPKDPFGKDNIHYDAIEQLLWSVGVDGDADKGYPGAPAPLSYSSKDIRSSHPTYLLNPGPIPEPEERKSRCKQDPDIAPLEPLEEQTEDEQAEAI
jgi:hypothetical protein